MLDILDIIDFLINTDIFIYNEKEKFDNTIPSNTKNSSQKYTTHKNKIIATKNIIKWETILFLETPKQIKKAKAWKKIKDIAGYKQRKKNITFKNETQITAIKDIKKWEILYLDYPNSLKPLILFPNKIIYSLSQIIFVLSLLIWIITIGINI